MKKTLYILTLLFTSAFFAQNTTTYYLEIKEGYELGAIQKTTNTDQTLTFSINNQDFADVLNNGNIFSFEKAYPSSQTTRLQRVYKLKVSENFSSETTILQRSETEKFFVIEDEQLIVQDDNIILPNQQQPISSNLPPPFILPNDYNDPYSGERYTAYDLIKLPLAWTITTGSPDVLVGVDDAAWNLDHPDLIGQIDNTHFISSYNGDHGLAVSGKIVAKANNNQFIAGIAYDSKVVFVYTNGGATDLIEGLLWLANETDVRVINCSWGIHENSSYKDDLDLAMEEIEALPNPPLIIGIAHNQGTTDYYYPACYDSDIVLGITNVGHRYPIGQFSPPEFWEDSWPDCHYYRPFFGEGTNNHNDKLDVVAPGILVTNITNNYADYPEGYRIASNTSSTAPYVTGVAALVFSANPSLTAAQVKDIIKNTADDIYYIPYNEPFLGQLGTGRINAFRAVKTAKCMAEPSNGIDLAMQNSDFDYFIEPDPNTDMPWRSDDIWVRNQNDGNLVKEHQNPEYDPNNPNYVYVRVTNNSCEASTGTDNLKLYWAKANTALSWPEHWDGTLYIHNDDTNQDVLMGDEIATLTIPPLEIGQEAIIEFEWNIPNPEDYENINDNPWHFCLLARIDTPNDPMTFLEGESITQNVLNNNNIAWKNTTVVDIIPDDTPSPIGGVVAVGNYFSQQKAFTLELVKENNELGKSIYEEAEVAIEMDDVLYNAWVEGGKVTQNTDSTKVASKIIITGNNAIFNNIILDPNEIGTLYLTFNFLTKELTNKREFTYHLIQRDAVTNEVIGGETFEVRKKPRDSFSADAGSDEEIDKNETITIIAGQINEDAVYNWYDSEGNLIYTGTDLTVSPDVTKKYKLEIISNIDGFKDYDEVEITVNPYKLESLIPNPASQSFTVNYLANGASSAYVMVVNMNTGNSDNFILDVQQNNTAIDISTYTSGLYNIILVCDGEIQNSKILLKQ